MPTLWKSLVFLGFAVFVSSTLSPIANARDIRINIPKRSRLTPVQRLNREGVEAVRKHQYDKAKALFYKAYLFDPGDPFTLNNLGYVAELEGQVERAHSFYSLATAQATDALIDRASSSKLEGESLEAAVNAIRDLPMQINRANVEAVRLLSEGRVREADATLREALALDPQNGFTLNNIGVTKEAEGEFGEALKYYNAAANARIEDVVVVTTNGAARGKQLSEVAQQSANRLRERMKTMETTDAKVAVLNLRGVSAMNRNDWREAGEDFSQAYKLDPENAFSLNNQGYMAEMNGDLETAQEFYREARNAGGAGTRVGLATRADAEGMKLLDVADHSDGQVSKALDAASEKRRQNPGPIQLKRRDGTVVSPSPATTQPQTSPPSEKTNAPSPATTLPPQ